MLGTLRGLFEKVQHRIDIGVWESWRHLYTVIGDPSSRPPHIGSGWFIPSSWADKIVRSWLLLSVGALLIEKGRMFFGLKREFK